MLSEQIVLHQQYQLMKSDVVIIFFIRVIPLLSSFFGVERKLLSQSKLFSQSVHALLVNFIRGISILVCPQKIIKLFYVCILISPQCFCSACVSLPYKYITRTWFSRGHLFLCCRSSYNSKCMGRSEPNSISPSLCLRLVQQRWDTSRSSSTGAILQVSESFPVSNINLASKNIWNKKVNNINKRNLEWLTQNHRAN